MKSVGLYAGAMAVVLIAVGAIGASLPAAVGRAVWLGVVVAYVAQLVGAVVFSVWLMPDRRLIAHGLEMLWRVLVLAAVAFVLLRADAAVTASVLLAMVAFFFVSTVLEPLFLRIELLKRR